MSFLDSSGFPPYLNYPHFLTELPKDTLPNVGQRLTMRFPSFPLFAALAQCIALSYAIPIVGGTSSSALASRSEHCYNAPDTIAGT